jgi:hypothetical protein
MEKATRYHSNEGQLSRRRGRLPRLVIWLALLVALLVAALGAAMTQTAPTKSMDTHRVA